MRKIVVGALVGAFVVVARPAAAQPINPMTYCAPGVNYACFALGGGGSDGVFSLWLQNLQGSVTPDPTRWGIHNVKLMRTNPVDPASGLTSELVKWGPMDQGWEGRYRPGSNSGGRYEHDMSNDIEWAEYQEQTYYTGSEQNGIYGCSPWVDPWGADYVVGSTCPAAGVDGWYRFDFSAAVYDGAGTTWLRDLTLADIAITVRGVAVNAGGLAIESTACSIYGEASGTAPGSLTPACLAGPYEIAVVPEPATLALTGGGLALLAVGYRRHRLRAV